MLSAMSADFLGGDLFTLAEAFEKMTKEDVVAAVKTSIEEKNAAMATVTPKK